jgi:hypothetical protein
MTKEEFIEKYGEVTVFFSSYYKYTFSFAAYLDDEHRIVVEYGGDANDIYRFEVETAQPRSIKNLGDIHAGTVYKGTTVVECFYDY